MARHQEPVGVPPHQVEPARLEAELLAGPPRAEHLEQVDGVALRGLRRRRDAGGDRRARQVETRQLATQVRDLGIGEDRRQPVADRDLLVEHRPHLAVVPEIRLAVPGQRRRHEMLVRAAVQQLGRPVQPVVVLGEQEERAVVRRLGDDGCPVVEQQPVHPVGRHHRAQFLEPVDPARVAVITPCRLDHVAMTGVVRVHVASLPHRAAATTGAGHDANTITNGDYDAAGDGI